MGLQVKNAVDAGDGDLLLRQLRERLTADPANLEVRLQLAATYLERGSTELAIEHCRLAAERHPNSEKVALLLAQGLHTQGQTASAAEGLEAFLASHPPAVAESAGWLGLLHDALEDYAKGESAHRSAVTLQPASARLHNNLGYNLLMQGKRDAAIESFRRALQLQPRMELARNNLGLALARGGSAEEQQEALTHWKSIVEPAAAHNNLAAVLIEQGRFGDARRELEVALGFRKDFVPALKNLALVATFGGQSADPPKPVSGNRQGLWNRFWAALVDSATKPLPATRAN